MTLETSEFELAQNRKICGVTMLPPRFSLKYLNELPNIHSGHFDNIKDKGLLQGREVQIMLSRMTVADGAPCNNMVTVVCKAPPAPGRPDWIVIDEYEAKEV